MFRVPLVFTLFLLALVIAVGPAFAQSAPDFAAAQNEAVKFLSDLVKIDTSNPPGNEVRAGEYMKGVLATNGIPAQIYESAPGRGNLVARLKGSGKKKPLLLMAHLDVVGVERDKWTVDPFGAVIKDGHLYGRGAIDFKGGMAVFARAVMMLAERKVSLARDVIFLAEEDEESGGPYSTEWLARQAWSDIDAEFALN